ncbi:hypothetical protein CRYUN_Cryun12cG0068700 [Craigia yunnanensis]
MGVCISEQGAGGNGSSKQSRNEKKSSKAMLKLGKKSVLGVSRVTIKRTKNVIFGEAKIEDLSAQLQSQAPQQFKLPDMASLMPKLEISVGSQADEEEDDVDETGVETCDID